MQSWIHEFFISRWLDQAPQKLLLGEPHPSVSMGKAQLLRAIRVHLARLWCGHHPPIRSYECRLRPEHPSCRWCSQDVEYFRLGTCLGFAEESQVAKCTHNHRYLEATRGSVEVAELMRDIGMIYNNQAPAKYSTTLHTSKVVFAAHRAAAVSTWRRWNFTTTCVIWNETVHVF